MDFDFWAAELDPHTPALDIHGMRAAEAIEKIERFVDTQLMNNYRVIKIIHGSGTGVLRSVTEQVLRAHPRITGIKASDQLHELSAVTYASLR